MLDHYNDNLRKLIWKAKGDKGKHCTASWERTAIHRKLWTVSFHWGTATVGWCYIFLDTEAKKGPRDCRTLKSWNVLDKYQGNKGTSPSFYVTDGRGWGSCVSTGEGEYIKHCEECQMLSAHVKDLQVPQLRWCPPWASLQVFLHRCSLRHLMDEKGKGGALLFQGQKQRGGVRHIMFYCL